MQAFLVHLVLTMCQASFMRVKKEMGWVWEDHANCRQFWNTPAVDVEKGDDYRNKTGFIHNKYRMVLDQVSLLSNQQSKRGKKE